MKNSSTNDAYSGTPNPDDAIVATGLKRLNGGEGQMALGRFAMLVGYVCSLLTTFSAEAPPLWENGADHFNRLCKTDPQDGQQVLNERNES